jgi:hypothetical protein
MLKHLQKFFKPASADNTEEVPMTEQDKATFAAAETKAAELTVALETAATTLAAKEAAFAALTTQYDIATAALAQSAEAQAALIANAKAAVMTARTEKLSAIMGDVQGPKTAASLESLDDAAFAVVLSSYAANFAAEARSAMFVEKGVAAEAAPVVEEDAVSRLAASLAAQFKTN